jgi:CrcB protein
MIDVVLVSIGGFFGAICRFTISNKLQNQNKTALPMGTITVNLIGAFLLGIVVGMHIKGFFYALLGVGFMGAFTTFSTLQLELEQLRQAKNPKGFYKYLLISYLIGIILAFCGLIIGKAI